VRRGIRAVDRDLHAFDAEPREAPGGALVDVAAVGFDLQGDAACGEQLDNVPEVSHAERLAAAERDIGNAAGRDAAGELERLAPIELVAPGAVRAGFFAAGDAARAAAIGELPRKKKGRTKLVNRASTARPRIGVNCWTYFR
jgi:hypothetical protein